MLFRKASGGLSIVNIDDLIQQREAWKHTGLATFMLAYGSLGVIYGDIGTSPLYAMAGIFSSFEPNGQDVLGAISLIFWSITLIVLIKYVLIVLQANDHGEGGTFAMYTRLCRIIGISAASSDSMNKSEHAAVLQTAAMAGKIREVTSLARATRKLAKLLSKYSRVNRFLSRTQAHLEAEASVAAAEATVDAHVHERKPGLIHKWAFPSHTIKHFFQQSAGARATLLTVSVLATAMVVGDGVLTPAISVVSAVDGLTLKTDITQDGIIGISVAILVGLFTLQSLGTHRVAFLFSPVVVVWMLSILSIGIYNLSLNGGDVLQGLSPHHIIVFFRDHGALAWESLGGVMLCLTGAEALFADLGHFSIGAVSVGFSFFVYPCIIFAYLGQGAHLMNYPEDVDHVFWATVPDAFFWPMLVISTCTAVVASQALITGAFSIIRQAMTLGVFPPLHVVHTGEEVEGQIYIGAVNTVLMLLSIAVVAGFGGDGAKIGNAYGIAVATVMLVTTCLLVLVMLVDWEISAVLVVPFALLFLVMEGAFLSANLIKLPQGGWFTIAVASGVALIMFVWMSGQRAKDKALAVAKHSTSATIANLLKVSESGPEAAAEESAVPLPRYTPPGADRASAERASVGGRTSNSRCSLQTRGRRLGSDLQPAADAGGGAVSITVNGSGDKTGDVFSRMGGALQHRGSAAATAGGGGTRTRSDDGSGAPSSAQRPPRASGRPLPKVFEEPDSPRTNLRKSASMHIPAGSAPPAEGAEDGVRAPLVRIAMSSDDGRGGGGTVAAAAAPGGKNHHPLFVQGYASSAPDDPAYLAAPAVLNLLQVGEHDVGLAKLRGMGVYYANCPHGMPPVMWHFLRNVEAVHEVVVLLQNQVLPIPHLTSLPGVDVSHRFGSCTLVAGVPNMYRVAARYGYMDLVDNGPEFAEQVKEFIKKSVGSQGPGCEAGASPSALALLSRQQQQEAIELLDQSHEQGVVYYMGRTRLRMKRLKNSVLQLLHNVWYGDLYRFLAINAWDKVETWRIPHNSMVEIAMVLEI